MKNNQNKRINDTNQPQINNIFSPDREKCKRLLVLQTLLVTCRRIINTTIK